MGNGPVTTTGKGGGPVVAEEHAKMPDLYARGPGIQPMTEKRFLELANSQVGHVTITAEVLSKA